MLKDPAIQGHEHVHAARGLGSPVYGPVHRIPEVSPARRGRASGLRGAAGWKVGKDFACVAIRFCAISRAVRSYVAMHDLSGNRQKPAERRNRQRVFLCWCEANRFRPSGILKHGPTGKDESNAAYGESQRVPQGLVFCAVSSGNSREGSLRICKSDAALVRHSTPVRIRITNPVTLPRTSSPDVWLPPSVHAERPKNLGDSQHIASAGFRPVRPEIKGYSVGGLLPKLCVCDRKLRIPRRASASSLLLAHLHTRGCAVPRTCPERASISSLPTAARQWPDQYRPSTNL
jgi:hypothetical protein